MTVNERIGKKIKELRKEKGLTQNDFANKFNLTQNTVTNIETGKRTLSCEELLSIANYFKVSTDYLIKENGAREHEKLQYFLDYTGLSELSVEILNSYTWADKDFLLVLDTLIKNAEQSPLKLAEDILDYPLELEQEEEIKNQEELYRSRNRGADLLNIIKDFVGYTANEEKLTIFDNGEISTKAKKEFDTLLEECFSVGNITNKEIFDILLLKKLEKGLDGFREDFLNH